MRTARALQVKTVLLFLPGNSVKTVIIGHEKAINYTGEVSLSILCRLNQYNTQLQICCQWSKDFSFDKTKVKYEEMSVCLFTALKCDFIFMIPTFTDVGIFKLSAFKIAQF
jgi:hypothetical protein